MKPELLTNRESAITTDDEENVRTRAYELYEARNREEGHDVEDWLEAEAEITGTTVTTAAA